MIEPYFDDGIVTIYHADCHNLMPLEADVVVTDPPYGISYSPGRSGKSQWGEKSFVGSVVVGGDDEPFDPEFLLGYPCVALFGANHYADKLPASPGWLVWDKRDGMNSNDFADCELIWTSMDKVARLFRHRWVGALRDSERGEPRVHPTQKPVAVMRWVLSQCPDGTVLDPFMGSGSTLRAAADMGRRAIGIEREEVYCEAAAKRLAQGSLFS